MSEVKTPQVTRHLLKVVARTVAMVCLLVAVLLLSICLRTNAWVVAPISSHTLQLQKLNALALKCPALRCTASPDTAVDAADSTLQAEGVAEAEEEAASSYMTFKINLEKPIGLLLDEICAQGTESQHFVLLSHLVQPGQPGVRVAGTVEGGSAAASGAITEGMQLMSVYGEDCRNLSFDE
eukprot:13406-Heterococcus_DN1.PRE.2